MMPILVKDDDTRSGTNSKALSWPVTGSKGLVIFPCQNATLLILYLPASLLKFTHCHVLQPPSGHLPFLSLSCSCLTLPSDVADRLHGSWCNKFLVLSCFIPEHNVTHALLKSSLMPFYSSSMLRSEFYYRQWHPEALYCITIFKVLHIVLHPCISWLVTGFQLQINLTLATWRLWSDAAPAPLFTRRSRRDCLDFC